MKKCLKYIAAAVAVLLSAACEKDDLTAPSGVTIAEESIYPLDPYVIRGNGFQEGDLIVFESKDTKYRFQSQVEPGTVTSEGATIYMPEAFVYEVEYNVYLVRGIERVLLGTAIYHRSSKSHKEITLQEGMDFCGLVSDEEGNPVVGATISDGYNCVLTDEEGIYQMKSSEYSYRIFISLPAEYKVPMEEGLPCFWKTIEVGTSRYDFDLEKLDAPEPHFYLFCLADPQCQNQNRHVTRFRQETAPDVLAMAKELSAKAPVYGITLGDIGYNNEDTDFNSKNGIFPAMKVAMAYENLGLPLFQVIGNHDNRRIDAGTYNVAQDIAAESAFANAFGPVNYSFNRGDVHIVAMDNILFTNHGSYSMGFRDDQVEWLAQDLATVPKDKMIILCVHIPVGAPTSGNAAKVLQMLSEYKELHVMAGHTHYAANAIYSKYYQHTHGAVCGAWWYSTVNCDGTPNGYAIYNINGATITDWQYKGVGLSADAQIRMYRADMNYMADKIGYFRFDIDGSDYIWANIWNWDNDWTVQVYEDGVLSGNMTLQQSGTRRDAWAVGYHIGVVGRSGSYDKTNVTHLFYYQLKNPAAQVEVRATDRFGRTYSQKTFTGNTKPFWPMAPQDVDLYN